MPRAEWLGGPLTVQTSLIKSWRGICGVVAVSCASFIFVEFAQAERLLASRNDLEAVLPDNFECSTTIPFIIRSKSEELFIGDKVELQKLLGGLRVVFQFECPEAENFIVDGQVDGRAIFKATVSKESDWKLNVLIEPQMANPEEQEKGDRETTTAPIVDKTDETRRPPAQWQKEQSRLPHHGSAKVPRWTIAGRLVKASS